MALTLQKATSAFLFFCLFLFQNLQINAQGELWGTTYTGGDNNIGVIYKVNSDGTGYSVEHHFNSTETGTNPFAGLVQSSNGKFYGTTYLGGSKNSGVLFEYDPISKLYSKKVDFDSLITGSTPYGSLLAATNGKLYGVNSFGGTYGSGTLFEFDTETSILTTKYSFNLFDPSSGGYPYADLIQASNGKLYGTTYIGGAFDVGVLFEFDIATSQFTKKADFNLNDGAYPGRNLVEALPGKLYGATAYGGINNYGVLFEFDIALSALSVKENFASINLIYPWAGLCYADGKLFGTTLYGGSNEAGGIFEFDLTTSTLLSKFSFSISEGYYSFNKLLKGENGKLFGTALYGGANNYGVVFEFDPVTNIYNKKHDFEESTGSTPYSSLTQYKNELPQTDWLWGTAYAGGEHNLGVIFKVKTNGTNYTIEHHFKPDSLGHTTSGSYPQSALTLASNGKLYGVTGYGGSDEKGVLFEYDPNAKIYNARIHFDGANGAYPFVALTPSKNGKLYGVTYTGGANDAGTLFEYDLATTTLIKKLDFGINSALGSYPISQLLEASNGKLYGVTGGGGETGWGVLFEYDPDTETYTKKFDFTYQISGTFNWTLAEVTDGKLFGTTSYGGENNSGTIFEFDINTGICTTKFDFKESAITVPYGSILKTASSKLYGGTLSGGNQSMGGIYEYDWSSGTFSEKISMSQENGFYFLGGLIEVNSKLYGVTYGGGATGVGVLFEFNPVSGSWLKIHDFDYETGYGPVGSLTFVQANPGKSQTQIITFEAVQGKTYGDNPFELTATASSHLPVTYTSSNTSVATINGNTITIVGAGTTTITAQQSGDDTFFAADAVEQLLTVNKASQSISFDELATKTYGDQAFDLIASASSYLSVSYESVNKSVATVNGNSITIIGAGTTIITAVQEGNANFNSAEAVQQTLTVNKASQTITFDPLASKTIGDSPFNPGAVSSAGLAILYSSFSDKVSITENTVTLLKAGSVTIEASQPGNYNYISAEATSQTFCINPAKPVITVNDNSGNLTLTSSSEEGNQWYLNSEAISDANSNTLEVTSSGEYAVQVTIDNCSSVPSNNYVAVITAVENVYKNQDLKIYPNPALNELVLDFTHFDESQEINISVLDLMGKQKAVLQLRGGTREVLHVETYTPSQYILRTSIGQQVLYYKFVKQ